jgi:hypothetical protein
MPKGTESGNNVLGKLRKSNGRTLAIPLLLRRNSRSYSAISRLDLALGVHALDDVFAVAAQEIVDCQPNSE